MIALENVTMLYKGTNDGLDCVNLKINNGEIVYLIGKTGAGKSTLVKVLTGENKPQEGIVYVDGVDVAKLRRRKTKKYRQKIGVVFQDFRLLKNKTVKQNLLFAAECIHANKKQAKERVAQVLEFIGLSDKADYKPNKLSGGQIQRVSIGRAIMNAPSIIIADEPTGNLDVVTSNEVMSLIEKTASEEMASVLIVTHDLGVIKTHPHRVVVLENGKIVADLDKEEAVEYIKSFNA